MITARCSNLTNYSKPFSCHQCRKKIRLLAVESQGKNKLDKRMFYLCLYLFNFSDTHTQLQAIQLCFTFNRKNVSSDVKNNACSTSGGAVALPLSLAQESTSSSSTSAAITVDTIPSPNSYSWSPALYHTHGI